jgi:porin
MKPHPVIQAGLAALVVAGYAAPASSQLNLSEGITGEVAYTADFANIVAGGAERGSSYLDNVDLTASLELGTLLGWGGATAFFYVLGNNGSSPSELAGDLQTLSNLDAPDTWKLYEGWIEQELASGRLSLKAGLYDLNSEFDAIETGSVFMNSSHGIGPDLSQTGENGPSIFPTTSLALRARASLSESVQFSVVVLDGVPGDVDDPGGTHVTWTREEGLLISGEFEYHTARDVWEGGGRIALGAYLYTSQTDRLQAVPDPSATPSSKNNGLYVLGERSLYRRGEGGGLFGFFRAGIADSDVNQIGIYLGGGLVYIGLLQARGSDRIGLAVGHARNGSHFIDSESAQGRPTDKAETAIELSYSAPLTEWLSVQPDVQYIVNPGMNPTLDNALVLSVRATISF